MSHQIKCITKPERSNHHEAIERVGGVLADGRPFNISRQSCAERINNGEDFHVKIKLYDVKVIAYRRSGSTEWFIKTNADATAQDNLLSLLPCQ